MFSTALGRRVHDSDLSDVREGVVSLLPMHHLMTEDQIDMLVDLADQLGVDFWEVFKLPIKRLRAITPRRWSVEHARAEVQAMRKSCCRALTPCRGKHADVVLSAHRPGGTRAQVYLTVGD